MAIEVYQGNYSGSEIDAAIADVGTLNGLVPTGASSSNKLATASDITGITDKIPSGASSSNQMATASDITSITEKIPASASSSNQMATASDITGITDKIPSGASASNKLATASDITGINEKIPSGASASNQMATASDITSITEKIPAAASSSNQLADKDFVNSSIGSNTGNYISDNGNPFTSVASLEAYSGTVHNNDYAFVTGTDTYGNEYYDRYKATVSGSTVTWAKEYRLNNSTFTSAQWSAINSGITSSLIPSGASSSNQFATESEITGITEKIPSGASSSNKMATASDISAITDLIPSGASVSNQLATASDIPDISGINAVIPSSATASNQLATESEITGITDLIPTGASTSNKLSTASDISGINDKIPSSASSSNKLATASDITGITDLIPSGASTNNKLSTASDISGITEKIPATASSSNKLATASDITGITEKIPAAASSSNQLADKSYVNSSVSTNTANYISNNGNPFASVADLEAYSGTVTNNDYAFVTGTDISGNTYYDRYKATVSGSTVTWAKEYRLNNSSFTSTQWDAINSGITSGIIPSGASSNNKLATMSDIPSASGIAGVQINSVDLTPDANNKVNVPVASTSALGVIKTSTNYKTDIATEYTYSYTDANDDPQTISGTDTVYTYDSGTTTYTSVGAVWNQSWSDNTYYYKDGASYFVVSRSNPVVTNALSSSTVTYANYDSMSNSAFISKGTLDNVLTATIGDIQSIIQGVL